MVMAVQIMIMMLLAFSIMSSIMVLFLLLVFAILA